MPVVVLTNGAVIASVLANQVTPRLDAGPCIDDHILIRSIGADLGWYNAPAPFGTGYGLTVNLEATYHTGTSEDGLGYFWPSTGLHLPVSAKIYVRVLGYDPYNAPGRWQLEIVTTDISLPWWLTVPLMAVSVATFCLAPVLVTLESVLFAGLVGAVDGLLGSAELGVASGGNATLTKATVSAIQSVTIPGTTIGASIDLWNYGFSSEGAETWLKASAFSTAASQAIGLQLNNSNLPIGASNDNVYYNTPTLDLQVVTAPNFPDPSSVFIQWSISRKDTNAVIASKASRLSDPGGGTFSVSRVTPTLQAVTEFTISVTIFQPGVVASYNVDVKVVDWLDRSHRFVKWTSHTWFADPKKPRQWIYYWERVRPSRIHRTDWPGRCRRLSPPSSILPALMQHDWPTPLAKNKFWAQFVPEQWSYLDELPFTSVEDAIGGRRGVLCDYCFFGGPTKTTLLVSVP